MSPAHQVLFGGPWKSEDWESSDDRVRGGKSQSYLKCSTSEGRFTGELDIKTLGGAGFASQRTTGDRKWDLSAYDGITLDVAKADSKRYTFILKDELLPRSDNGRDQATTSYEYDFVISASSCASEDATSGTQIFIAWKNFKPTYRGKEKKDAKPLNNKSIRRMNIMMRSFFGDQEGPFSISLRSITATLHPSVDHCHLEKGHYSIEERKPRWDTWLQSLTLKHSPWKVCGCVLLAVAVCYTVAQRCMPGSFRGH